MKYVQRHSSIAERDVGDTSLYTSQNVTDTSWSQIMPLRGVQFWCLTPLYSPSPCLEHWGQHSLSEVGYSMSWSETVRAFSDLHTVRRVSLSRRQLVISRAIGTIYYGYVHDQYSGSQLLRLTKFSHWILKDHRHIPPRKCPWFFGEFRTCTDVYVIDSLVSIFHVKAAWGTHLCTSKPMMYLLIGEWIHSRVIGAG